MSAFEGSVLEEALAAQEDLVPTPAPRKLDEIDIIKLENAFLKIENFKRSKQLLDQQSRAVDQQILVHQQQLRAFRDVLSAKYGVDLTEARIDTDGTITPNASSGAATPAGNPIATALSTPQN